LSVSSDSNGSCSSSETKSIHWDRLRTRSYAATGRTAPGVGP
jgi:hypothetical protein